MKDDDILRLKARERLKAAAVPASLPARTWGGPGGGQPCAICEAPIKTQELEIEVEFRDDPREAQRHCMHIRCYDAWDGARQELEERRVARPAARAPAGRALPEVLADGRMTDHGGGRNHGPEAA